MTPPLIPTPPERRPAAGPLRPLMLAGTGSDVGKSVLATALCRIFLQDGYHPAPFKAQNMALNSFATPEGLEIGRAQAVQAEAAGVPCHTDMNPLLLKPQSDRQSQVVLHGRPIGPRDAYDFWRRPQATGSPAPDSAEGPDAAAAGRVGEAVDFRAEVCQAFDRLSARYNPIVMEGAGSISELNLREHDLVNLPMARHAGACVVLVADIDRGGVFASVYGSIMLQTPADRRLIRGVIINKFRGDLRLFADGRRMLEELCGVPVLGVVPHLPDLHIEGEDSVALQRAATQAAGQGVLSVAVVRLPFLSNYTDFDALGADSRVHLYYTASPDELLRADVIVLPGTKSTMADLQALRRSGCAEAIVRAHRMGKTVLGICGGFQMMGVEVLDPEHVEGPLERLPGLGLLPVSTTMTARKVTRQVHYTAAAEPAVGEGYAYEIHMGRTVPFADAPERPLALLADGTADGYIVSPRCMGTYLHGVLDNGPFLDFLLAPFADRLQQRRRPVDYQAYKQQQYDLLADHVRRHVDVERIYQILSSHD